MRIKSIGSWAGFRNSLSYIFLLSLLTIGMGCSGQGGNSSEGIDSTFGNGGAAQTPVNSGDDTGRALAIQSDGKILVAGCSVLDSFCKFGLVRYQEDGSLDAEFGTNGRVTTSVGPGEDGAYAVALQSDGKIVAAGATFDGSNKDIALLRYNSDGTLDPTFGAGSGIVTSAIGMGDDSANAVAIQPDGKILVAGCSFVGNFCKFMIARYDAEGNLDVSFGSSGSTITSIGSGEDGAYGMALQSDGKIVVAGATFNGTDKDIALIRYNADGSLDTSFGNGDGIVQTAVAMGNDQANGMAIQEDGKIVIAGCAVLGSNCKVVVARYDPDGTLDASFSGGMVTTSVGNGEDGAYGVAILPDGKIAIAGATFNGSDRDFLLIRYNPEGSLDSTFAEEGVAQLSVGEGEDFANGIAIDSDGRLVSAGTAFNGANQDFAAVRYR